MRPNARIMSIKEQPHRGRSAPDALLRPTILLPYGTTVTLKGAVKEACPNLAEVTTTDIEDAPVVEDVLSRLGVRPDQPFCLTARMETAYYRQFLAAEQFYPEGFPLKRSWSDISLRRYLAACCLPQAAVPAWLGSLEDEIRDRERSGVSGPSFITVGRAREYFDFIDKLWKVARTRFDECLMEEILAAEVALPPEDLYSVDPADVAPMRTFTIFSAGAIDAVVDTVANDQYRRCDLDPDLHRAIDDNFSFWVRSGGVIAEEVSPV